MHGQQVIKEEEEEEHHHHEDEKKGMCKDCNFTPFVLMMALSFHAIFEGLACGLNPSPQVSIDLMIAITLHKYAEAMSLSIAMQRAMFDHKLIIKLMFIFCFATPLGMSLGLILQNAPEIITVTFTSLCGGTFLYIACSEVITEEFSLPGGRWFKLLSFLIGAAIITMLWLLDKS